VCGVLCVGSCVLSYRGLWVESYRDLGVESYRDLWVESYRVLWVESYRDLVQRFVFVVVLLSRRLWIFPIMVCIL